jgi:hypothetical protein
VNKQKPQTNKQTKSFKDINGEVVYLSMGSGTGITETEKVLRKIK